VKGKEVIVIVNLDRKKLAETFENTIDPNLLYEEAAVDHDDDTGTAHEHHHHHELAPVEPGN
jgi:hypothetical protein